MNYEKSPNETEILNADEHDLRALCRALKKVEAPPDFDFKLKARLAAGRPAHDFQPRRFGFAFRYALPALALVIIVGLLAYSGGFLSPNDNSPVVAGPAAPQLNQAVEQNPAATRFAPPENATPANSVALVTPAAPVAPEKALPKLPAPAPSLSKKALRKKEKDTFVGTKVFASTEEKAKQPKLNGVIVPKNAPAIAGSNPIPVREVLSIMGIGADLENGRWTVKSVSANSVGEISGVKTGDVIEAIDDQPLATGTISDKTVNGKTITVTRRGERSRISLRAVQ